MGTRIVMVGINIATSMDLHRNRIVVTAISNNQGFPVIGARAGTTMSANHEAMPVTETVAPNPKAAPKKINQIPSDPVHPNPEKRALLSLSPRQGSETAPSQSKGYTSVPFLNPSPSGSFKA